MKTPTEMKAQILSRAEADGDFRALLMTDPKAAVADETGVTVPDGFKLVVHEDSATTAHLVLPPSPELSEADLAMATGGMGTVIW
jgi:hypothetical protein